MFERVVQAYFLIPSLRLLQFGKIYLKIDEVGYFYHCGKTLADIIECQKSKKCKVFHFLQKNHFAFDSLIYDGSSQALILIQIRINRNHECHYESIYHYINEKPNPTKKDKYHSFFSEVSGLVNVYIFQWMTSEKFSEIQTTSEEFKKKHPDSESKNKLEIEYVSKDLLEELSRNERI